MGVTIEEVVGPSLDQWLMVIDGLRLPMWSEGKSDSRIQPGGDWTGWDFILGKADLALLRKLVKAGSDHRKVLRMLPIMVKFTGPMTFLLQLDTYKVGTVTSSSSKMHKLMHKPFEVSDFSFANKLASPESYQDAIDSFNGIRDTYLSCEDPEMKKEIWQSVLDILPMSYNQTRVMSLNYEVLWSMYNARKHHKLIFWHEFLDGVIPQVPYFKEIFGIDLIEEAED